MRTLWSISVWISTDVAIPLKIFSVSGYGSSSHGCVLHNDVLTAAPLHQSPNVDGFGLLHSLLIFFTPPPHDTLQLSVRNQLLQPPCCGEHYSCTGAASIKNSSIKNVAYYYYYNSLTRPHELDRGALIGLARRIWNYGIGLNFI